ncbi:leishmanolysin family protein, putative [Ichthyophthirius multifiliis]|uniref:Leishmanolysin family protein, putative n=1 Tax=Ichthyophthirius multifiliis TaxID=5932 RepID=G0QLI7_ICHMU|nr:leishmanolysin family protein, putative [Ichthyophthirius multifiliis]EGR33921.1 leishmanolysin family protein, putative [Ichthyophthirius multifiliis]|eukprot:XP_004039225.1 leishmanolysin family protein, putative [Ichthyophthirius multifiliis]
MKIFILTLTLFLYTILSCPEHFEDQNYEPTVLELDTLNNNFRNLQKQQKPRNMIITFNYDQFSNLDTKIAINQKFKEMIQKAMDIAAKFFYDLITIVPKSLEQRKWNQELNVCGGGNLLAKIKQEERASTRDTDLHIYVTYANEKRQTYTAYAASCQEIKGIGPTHGQITFNFELITKSKKLDDPIEFSNLVDTVIHELIHVLGFNAQSYTKWVDKNKQPHINVSTQINVRGLPTTFLSTPNVLKFAREYYNCPTLKGFPLENQGGNGNKDGHWENTAILDELMRPINTLTVPIFSGFTAALLMDTGYYSSINQKMVGSSFYGKGAGCDFLTKECDENSREYCKENQKESCDYYNHAPSTCENNQFMDKNCRFMRAKVDYKCYDPNNFNNKTTLYTGYYSQDFGYGAKCFNSSIVKKFAKEQDMSLKPSCYKYTCSNDNKSLTIVIRAKKIEQSQVIKCTQDGQLIQATGEYEGQLKCPDKIEEFCQYEYICPNSCNKNGYCSKGKCVCLPQYRGDDCALQNSALQNK